MWSESDWTGVYPPKTVYNNELSAIGTLNSFSTYNNDDNTPKEREITEKIRKLKEELETRKDWGEQNLVIK